MGSIKTAGSKQPLKRKFEDFSRMIKFYEDLLFGLSLLSDGMAAYYRDQPNIFTLNEKTFQDIKRRIDIAIVRARVLFRQIKADKAEIAELARFEFPDLSAFPLIKGIVEQSQILVDMYERMFPGRSRLKPLNQQDLVILMAKCLEQFELLKAAERFSPFTKEIN